MIVLYKSTRGYEKLVSSSYAIINGLAEDKGLYVPFKIHKLKNSLEYLAGLPYEELAFCILKEFLDDFCDDDLKIASTRPTIKNLKIIRYYQ